MIKGLIFDFDGVIAESIHIKSEAFKNLYITYGDDIAERVLEHHENNGGMSRFEKIKYYHEVFLKEKISEQKIIYLSNQFSSYVVQKVIESSYIPGVLDYIEKSYNKYKLFISTGTPTEEIKEILIGKNIYNYFTDIFGSPTNKIEHINEILLNHSFKSKELIFYGDSFTDYDAAIKSNIEFILIKNKYNKNIVDKHNSKSINNFIGLV